ncbi:MAG: sulfatase [Actinomycetota bacterium]|nr:sulfatase [Actinomycetota bacterium]
MARIAQALILSLLILPPFATGTATPTDDRPNVLIIMTDDQRATGTYRVMPNTREWFMKGGTTYPKAWVTTPLCCPSRSTLFSGQYAHNHGVLTNDLAGQLDHTTTMQALLDSAGYNTAYVGRFLNGWGLRSSPPEQFDHWAAFPGNYFDKRFNIDGNLVDVPGYTTTFLGSHAIELMEDFEHEDDVPWLMYVATSAPHKPFLPEPRYEDAKVGSYSNPAIEETDLSDKADYVSLGSRGDPKAIRRGQLRTLMSVDDLVDKVMTKLDELDESRDTIAIFVSDNGFLWGENGLIEKRSPFTAALQIPLMVRWPGHVPAGEVDSSNVSMVDIAPTLYEATGVATDLPLDGRSLFGPDEREEMFFEHWAESERDVPDYASLRTDTYQYTEYYEGEGRLIPTFREYFDLVNDPWQLENLLGNEDPLDDPSPVDIAALQAKIQQYRDCAGTACP